MSADFVDKNLDCKPRPGSKFSTSAKITPEEGFLLSQADGRLTIKEILLVLPFDKVKVGEMLANLRRNDILTWEGGAPPPPLAASAMPVASVAQKTANVDDNFDDEFFQAVKATPATAAKTAKTSDDFGFAGAAPGPLQPLDDELANELDDLLGDAAPKAASNEVELSDDFDDELQSKLNPQGKKAKALGPIDSDLASELDDVVGRAVAASDADADADTAQDLDAMLNDIEVLGAEELAPEPDDNAAASLDPEALLADLEPAESETNADSGSADFGDLTLDEAEDAVASENHVDEIDPSLLEELEALDSDVDSIIASLADDEAEPTALEPDDGTALTEISGEDLDAAAAVLDEFTEDLVLHETTTSTSDDEPDDDLFGLDDQLTDIGAVLDDVFVESTASADQNMAAEPLDDGDDEAAATEAAPAIAPRPAKTAPKIPKAASGKSQENLSGDEKIESLVKRIRIQQRILEKDDPFEALGVKGGSSDKEIRDAWHRLSRVFHPDRYYSIELPADLTAELNDVYAALQDAYEKIGTREARRAFMFQRRDKRIKKPAEIAADGSVASEAAARKPDKKADAADGDRLAQLAEDALAKGQYKSAITNFKMAGKMTGKKEFENRAKLVTLLETFEARLEALLDSDEPPAEIDVQRIEDTLSKIKDVLPKNALLLRKIVQFLHENSNDNKLTRELVDRLLKLNRLPETLILGAKIALKANQPQAALDLLEDAKQRDANNQEIKSMIKDIKRSLK